MTAKRKDGKKIIVVQNRLICPDCRKGKLAKVLPTTKGFDLIFFCKQCRKEITVDIT